MTLVELLVVLVIIGLLGLLVAPNILGNLGRARSQTAQAQIDNIITAIDLFHLDVGRYPRPDEGLAALLVAPQDTPAWSGPYLRKRSALLDPWGQPFSYRVPGQHGPYDLFSLGSDKAPGGDGDARDVTSW